MPSQFFGLMIGSSGLRASNAALNTTGNNISNADTEGYSRQTVVQQAYEALRTFTTYGCAGAGVDTIAIERIRDEFYDTKYWNNQCLVGEYDVKQEYYAQIEAYFVDESTTDGFKTIFNQVVNALSEVEKNPASTTAKAQFIGRISSLCEYFNNLSGNIEDLQKSINQEIKVRTDEINSIASELATLNKQINVIEISTGGTANELRDRRAVVLDRLSEIVDIDVQEVKVIDPNNPDRDTGATSCIVKIAGNQLLVNGNDYNTLECVARTAKEKVNQSDIDGLYDIKWTNGQTFSMGASVKGSLKGLFDLRDGNNKEFFNGEVTKVVGSNVKIQVTEDYLTNLNKTNLAEQGKITLGSQVYYYRDWTFSQEYDPASQKTSYYYTFNIDEELSDSPVTSNSIGHTATAGKSVNYQGIPYYMSQMNEWIRSFSQEINDLLCAGYASNGEPGCPLLTGNDFSGGQYILYDSNNPGKPVSSRYDKWDKDGSVRCSEASYYKITAKNFHVLNALVQNADLLATKTDPAAGVDQYGVIQNITDMLGDKKIFRNCTAGDFLTCILSDISLNANGANTFFENYSNISYTIDNQRLSISGVDSDEEAMNLVQFQNSYNLASRMIQTMTEIYDRLILQTGV